MNRLSSNKFKGVEVLTTDLIAVEHGTEKNRITEMFRNNKQWFEEEVDVFTINRENSRNDENDSGISYGNKEDFESLFTANNQKVAYLFTESGYLNLIKIMNNKRSWEVFKKMKSVYFKAKAFDAAPKLDIDKMTVIELVAYKQEQLKRDVADIKEAVVDMGENISKITIQLDYHEDYFTIKGFYSLNKFRLRKEDTWQKLGFEAARVSRERDIEIKEVPDAKWGKIGTYHKDLLMELRNK